MACNSVKQASPGDETERPYASSMQCNRRLRQELTAASKDVQTAGRDGSEETAMQRLKGGKLRCHGQGVGLHKCSRQGLQEGLLTAKRAGRGAIGNRHASGVCQLHTCTGARAAGLLPESSSASCASLDGAHSNVQGSAHMWHPALYQRGVAQVQSQHEDLCLVRDPGLRLIDVCNHEAAQE